MIYIDKLAGAVRFKVKDTMKQKYSDYEIAQAITHAIHTAFGVLMTIGSPFTKKVLELTFTDGKASLPSDFAGMIGLYSDVARETPIDYEIRGGEIFSDAGTAYIEYQFMPPSFNEPSGAVSLPSSMHIPLVNMVVASLGNKYAEVQNIADNEILRMATGAYGAFPDSTGLV